MADKGMSAGGGFIAGALAGLLIPKLLQREPAAPALGASAWVVASDAPAAIRNFAATLRATGYPAWLCDGVADNVEIQAAIDALPALGGTVQLSEGGFNFAASVNFVKDGVTIRGQGTGTRVFLINGVNDNVFRFGDGALPARGNAVFENFFIDGNRANQSAGNGIYLSSVQNVHVRGMMVMQCHDNCVRVDGNALAISVEIFITDSYISDAGGDVIGLYGNTHGAKILGNTLLMAGLNSSGLGVNGGSDHVIVGNMFSEGYQGLRLYDADNSVVTGNQFLNLDHNAVMFDGGSHSIVFSGNLIYNPSEEAVSWAGLALNATDVTVVGNTIIGFTSAMAYGIRIYGISSRLLIVGNIIRNATIGISEEGTAGHNMIVNNLISEG